MTCLHLTTVYTITYAYLMFCGPQHACRKKANRAIYGLNILCSPPVCPVQFDHFSPADGPYSVRLLCRFRAFWSWTDSPSNQLRFLFNCLKNIYILHVVKWFFFFFFFSDQFYTSSLSERHSNCLASCSAVGSADFSVRRNADKWSYIMKDTEQLGFCILQL